MANQSWCKCNKDPRVQFSIPNRPDKVCWECFNKYLIENSLNDIDNQKAEELERRRIERINYPPMSREPFYPFRTGLTLIEVLVIVAIFSILSLLVVLGFRESTKQHQQPQCQQYSNTPIQDIPAHCIQYFLVTTSTGNQNEFDSSTIRDIESTQFSNGYDN